MTEQIVIGILGGLLLIEIVRGQLRERQAARERRELYSRIQAGSLGEFKATEEHHHTRPVKPESYPKSQPDETASLRAELPEKTTADLRAKFGRLQVPAGEPE